MSKIHPLQMRDTSLQRRFGGKGTAFIPHNQIFWQKNAKIGQNSAES